MPLSVCHIFLNVSSQGRQNSEGYSDIVHNRYVIFVHSAMHEHGLCYLAVSAVCPFVTFVYFLSKRVNLSSKIFHHRIATPF